MLPGVADANVLVSAAISSRGPSAQIVRLAQHGDIALWVCEKLIDEVADVLARDHLQKYISPDEASDYVDAITLLANWVDDLPRSRYPMSAPTQTTITSSRFTKTLTPTCWYLATRAYAECDTPTCTSTAPPMRWKLSLTGTNGVTRLSPATLRRRCVRRQRRAVSR